MSKAKPKTKLPKTKLKEKSENLTEQLNQIAEQSEAHQKGSRETHTVESTSVSEGKEVKENQKEISDAVKTLFNKYENQAAIPDDFEIDVPIDSLESAVGYTSLLRQMQRAYARRVAYYRSNAGGCLSIEEARASAFHACTNEEEALKVFDSLMSLPLEILNFVDLAELQSYSPRTAEWLWEELKREGKKEFESGHLAANITFPVGYMKEMWNIARYLGVRESFLNDWKPKGGIEVALIDMMAQSYFQWQYWLEQTVKRSETTAREEHPEYLEWQRLRKKFNEGSWMDGHWLPPTVSEQTALEHAVQMADRFNRIFMRTLRQLRDLRRYSPVTINNPNQVNIAADGGQQVNVNNSEGSEQVKDSSLKPCRQTKAGE